LWDVATGKKRDGLREPEDQGDVRGVLQSPSLAFAQDGKALCASYVVNLPEQPARTGVGLWDLATGAGAYRRIVGHEFGPGFGSGPVLAAALAPDGRTLAWAPREQGEQEEAPGVRERLRISLYDVASGQRLPDMMTPPMKDHPYSDITSVTFSADGKTLATG